MRPRSIAGGERGAPEPRRPGAAVAGLRAAFGGLLLALFAHASALGAPATVAVLKSADLPPYEAAVEGMANALRAARPDAVVVEFTLEGQEARWKDVQDRLLRKDPDVVVPVGSLALTLAVRDLKDVPIVFTMVLNPEKLVAAGSASVTGVSMNHSVEDQFRKIREGLPRAKRIAVLFDPAESAPAVAAAGRAASALGLTLVPVEVTSPSGLPAALRSLPGKADALWLLADRTVVGTSEALEIISLECLGAGIPVVGPSERFTRAGAIFSLSVDYADLGKQTGGLVAEVLGGRRPADRPVQSARTIAVTVNRKVAGALGITLPPAFLKGATETTR